MPTSTTVVGRRPIVDSSHTLAGYEILFGRTASSASPSGGHSSTRTDRHGYDAPATVSPDATVGDLERLTGDVPAFLAVGPDVITGQTSVRWPANRVVLQAPASLLCSPGSADVCARLRQQGYRLAATECPLPTATAGSNDDLLDLVDIVTVDARTATRDQLRPLAAQCRAHSVQLMLIGVDTPEAAVVAGLAQADLLQGLAVARPPAVASGALTPTQHNALRLASTIMRPETDLDAVENILRADPALAYQVLQLASIGRVGEPRRNLRSIREALVLMGIDRLRGWVPTLMLRPAGRAIDSRLPTVLARASAVETAAHVTAPDFTSVAFAAGMFSAFDLLLGIPRAALADALDVPPALHDHAFGADTPVARLISDIIDYEQGAPVAGRSELTPELLDHVAATGFSWALRAVETLDGRAAA